MSLEEARSFAECWVDKHKERIFEIIDKDFKFRDFFLRDLLVDDSQTAYPGLPAIYLTDYAQHDPTTFDILVDLSGHTAHNSLLVFAQRVFNQALLKDLSPAEGDLINPQVET